MTIGWLVSRPRHADQIHQVRETVLFRSLLCSFMQFSNQVADWRKVGDRRAVGGNFWTLLPTKEAATSHHLDYHCNVSIIETSATLYQVFPQTTHHQYCFCL